MASSSSNTARESSTTNDGPHKGGLSNLIRLAPFQVSELPPHPDLPQTEGDRPELRDFLLDYLNDGAAFLAPASFDSNFKHHSSKPAPPSSSSVEVLAYSVPSSALHDLQWAQAPIPRSKPRSLDAEHWFARRSYHPDISSKDSQNAGSASWKEFIFGLRDDHSKHEMDFTPTLYDARKVLDWNGSVRKLQDEGSLSLQYSEMTLGIFEMCHNLPGILNPRCFGVLVATASMGPNAFIAVTVPVNLTGGIKNVFYSNGHNKFKATDSLQKKEVVVAQYAAVERVTLDDEGKIEWLMATASNARGNLPMFAQKLGIPGTIIKDVGFFIKWIKTVDDEEVGSPMAGTGDASTGRRLWIGGSSS